ncbi:MAG: hypothetical protein AAF696_15795 [Bacteroidota bacterium]
MEIEKHASKETLEWLKYVSWDLHKKKEHSLLVFEANMEVNHGKDFRKKIDHPFDGPMIKDKIKAFDEKWAAKNDAVKSKFHHECRKDKLRAEGIFNANDPEVKKTDKAFERLFMELEIPDNKLLRDFEKNKALLKNKDKTRERKR